MLIKLRSRQGQIFTGEYIIVLALAAAAIMTMGVYFRRGVQARIRDANTGMLDIIRNKTADTYAGTEVYPQYEPYYVSADTISDINTRKEQKLFGSFQRSSGISQVRFNDTISRQSVSDVLPPSEAD